MSDGVTIAIITSLSAVVLAIVNAVIAWAQKRGEKKDGIKSQVREIAKDIVEMKNDLGAARSELRKVSEHNDLQYLSLLRLTVMDSDMPMSERLIAGKEYMARGGNGDVRKYYEDLERRVNG